MDVIVAPSKSVVNHLVQSSHSNQLSNLVELVATAALAQKGNLPATTREERKNAIGTCRGGWPWHGGEYRTSCAVQVSCRTKEFCVDLMMFQCTPSRSGILEEDGETYDDSNDDDDTCTNDFLLDDNTGDSDSRQGDRLVGRIVCI
ncbi:expressed unknown protein [Seminavis robusta]|uniref:Uncharacterized protein n=1 Tax=Seminavis robusta TaxID=568900 RepID=A0A9N8EFX8_9STRA|nr:expressed unknown protein [Seminavis robusta]|eukprot:Sro941_g222581.1  (146) ;mRNA; f:1316-1753